MKIGTAQIQASDLRDACAKLNIDRPDIKPEWVIQISPPNGNAIGTWVVVYRWEES